MGKEYIKVYVNSVDIIWIVDMLGIRNPLTLISCHQYLADHMPGLY